jgi:hypothetical protein
MCTYYNLRASAACNTRFSGHSHPDSPMEDVKSQQDHLLAALTCLGLALNESIVSCELQSTVDNRAQALHWCVTLLKDVAEAQRAAMGGSAHIPPNADGASASFANQQAITGVTAHVRICLSCLFLCLPNVRRCCVAHCHAFNRCHVHTLQIARHNI